ncbi:MAG: MBL fold metallo-hydrolase [Oscillospiraceae bacterium]|nr:MBL fold metallo-hydrolase [Oscillospiraceae bacterium]
MKIANNVEMLEIAGNGTFIYPTLVWDGGHLVLMDAGLPGQTEAIKQAVSDAGFSAENITEIILTHQDIDHTGCVTDLLNLAPSAKVIAHVEEAPYIDGRKTPIKLAAMLEKYDSLPDEQKAWCDMLKAGFSNRNITVNQTVKDGDVLPFCGGIEVVYTPGHTPGHMCLYLRESRIMVGGDALNIKDGQMTGPNPQHTYDMELGRKSLEKSKTFDISGLVSYHCGYLNMAK